jgi:hypothetical protein
VIDEIIEANVAEFGSLSVGAISDIKKVGSNKRFLRVEF